MQNMRAIDKLIEIADNEVGYLEKKSNTQLDDKTANAGTANYTKYWRDIKPEYQGEPWCAAFVTWCFVKAFGQATAKKLLKHYPYVYCPTMASLFKLNANPKKGDIVIFYRNGTFAHTGIVTSVSGDYFTTVEGNTSGGSSIIANGGGVCRKGYYNSNFPGTKFVTVDWSIVEDKEEIDMEQVNELKGQIAELKTLLTARGEKYDTIINKMGEELAALKAANEPKMIYNYADDNIPEWARATVKRMVGNGILRGNEKQQLGLTDDKLWALVVMDRLLGNE